MNPKQVGLYIMECIDSVSESSEEHVDPLATASSPARAPGPVVIREPATVVTPVASSPVVHGKGKNIRILLPSPPSSDDEDLVHVEPPLGYPICIYNTFLPCIYKCSMYICYLTYANLVCSLCRFSDHV